MVARNLDRGGSFLRPRLDTGPFPNYFVVEPPIYESAVVGFRLLTGLRLEPAGRAVSALGTTLASAAILAICAGMGRKELGLVSALVFSILPVTIRYGRAFQPDALAVGLVLSGAACWLRGEARKSRVWLAVGGVLLSAGLATKVIGVFALGVLAWDRAEMGWKAGLRRLAVLSLTLLPALAWYGYAATLLESGSRASRDSAGVWLGVLVPSAWGEAQTYAVLWRYFVVRAFTPLALGMAVVGWWRGGIGRFWTGWWMGALATLFWLAAKLHHEYYWLWLAPGVAVGAARVLVGWECPNVTRYRMMGGAPPVRLVVWGALVGLSAWLTRSTWQTPAEWRGLESAARTIDAHVSRDAGLIATEAVLYAADRRGYRLETTPGSIQRAVGEWGRNSPAKLATPEGLVGWYHEQGAQYLADVGDPGEGRRRGWVKPFRVSPYRVLVDRPGLFLVKLPEDADGDE